MELTKEEIITEDGNLCTHCNRKCFLPYEDEFISIAFDYLGIKQKK